MTPLGSILTIPIFFKFGPTISTRRNSGILKISHLDIFEGRFDPEGVVLRGWPILWLLTYTLWAFFWVPTWLCTTTGTLSSVLAFLAWNLKNENVPQDASSNISKNQHDRSMYMKLRWIFGTRVLVTESFFSIFDFRNSIKGMHDTNFWRLT